MKLTKALVIFHLCCSLLLTVCACGTRATSPPREGASEPVESHNSASSSKLYGPPVQLAQLEDQSVTESSGLVASRRNPELFWTHNDSGGGPFLYAFDRRGKARGVWRVAGAQARDWEDIAIGPGPVQGTSYLYIGDIGDNRHRRDGVTVYRLAEPIINAADASSSRSRPLQTDAAEAIRLKYTDGSHDAEALMVHPQTGDLYLITKTATLAKVYRAKAPLDAAGVTALEFVSELRLPVIFSGLVTGADIAPDGRRVVVCDYFGAYEMALARSSTEFDRIWKQPLATIPLGSRQQGEAVCYRLDGKAILATSEQRPTPLIEAVREK